MGGAFYMSYMCFIDPGIVFSVSAISVMMILVTMLGGAATYWGPAVGAGIYILVSELMRVYIPQGHLIVFGLLIIVIIIFLPNGVVGAWNDARAKKRRRAAADAADAAEPARAVAS